MPSGMNAKEGDSGMLCEGRATRAASRRGVEQGGQEEQLVEGREWLEIA